MISKKLIKKFLPNFIYSKIKDLRNSEQFETIKLNAVKKIKLNANNLSSSENINLEEIFTDKEIEKAWQTQEKQIEALEIPDLTGGVNIGDRKAIYFIISYLKPKSVLEIGTHIGASTVNIVSALDFNLKDKGVKSSFSTLDIRDVNCPKEKPWLKFKSPKSPQNLINSLNLEIETTFLNQNSLAYLEETEDTFDLIFLDGDHSAPTVYKEVPKALQRLNKGGVLLLHDYFKIGASANPNQNYNSGPYLGIQRHINEGAKLVVKPFGKLPWETKLNSNITSLALVFKRT